MGIVSLFTIAVALLISGRASAEMASKAELARAKELAPKNEKMYPLAPQSVSGVRVKHGKRFGSLA
jgi:hypothetical protein